MASDEDKNKTDYNPPLHPSPEGNKKSNNERLLKKIPLQRRGVTQCRG